MNTYNENTNRLPVGMDMLKLTFNKRALDQQVTPAKNNDDNQPINFIFIWVFLAFTEKNKCAEILYHN